MAEQTRQRRGWIFDKAAELEKELDEARAQTDEVRSQVGSAQDHAKLWQQRARDLKAVLNGIVMDPTSSRQDVQSKCLLALQRNEW